MLIDTHNHVNYQGISTDALAREMDALGIDQTWLLTWYLPPNENDLAYHRGTSPTHIRADGTHSTMPFSDIVDACHRYPDRFVAGYCPHPLTGDAPALFEAAYKMHNVRVCGEWSYRMLLDDPRSLNLFRKAGELGCPVVIHLDVPWLAVKQNEHNHTCGAGFQPASIENAARMAAPQISSRPQSNANDKAPQMIYQWRWYGGAIEAFERALAACPDTIFIGHAPGFWRYLGPDGQTSEKILPSGPVGDGGRLIKMFENYPNLWADLSAGSGLNALMRDSEFAKKFIQRYANRLLFGRDQHGDALLQFLDTLDLNDDVKQKLLWQNAQRLVRAE